ncbi:MAG TPA: aspartate--tRNA(Asn) ligase [Candidatus Portnoybacteria bacterium]|nr:aspartate--tRNA(Asn) ligase [Candidatus Portnoybacteria bacterium]
MVSRILSSELKKYLDQEVTLKGRVYNLRKLGKMNFLILQDEKELVQCLIEKEVTQMPAEKIRPGDLIQINGVAKEDSRAPMGVEIKCQKISFINRIVEDLPFDLTKKEIHLQLSTLFDHRALTLRNEKVRQIFRLEGEILSSYSQIMRDLGCQEIKTPKIIGAASEGGANFFSVNYFGRRAFLAQSPQLYKQICVGAFGRVFEVGPALRAEKHFTTRHLNEYISLDAEIGFIDDWSEIMDHLDYVVQAIVKEINQKYQNIFSQFGVSEIKISKKIPRMKLSEAKEILQQKYSHQVDKNEDLDPEGEKLVGQYILGKFNSDFVFLTHYPRKKRPFYTMPDGEDETKSFDLVYRGLEISSGGQRIHQYQDLIDNIGKKGLNPEDFKFYLEAFKYALPPHGGWGLGLERIVAKTLNLPTVKEASLFPRDVKRLVP